RRRRADSARATGRQFRRLLGQSGPNCLRGERRGGATALRRGRRRGRRRAAAGHRARRAAGRCLPSAGADALFGVCRKPEIESVRFTKTVAVRLFIGNLPYGASEADLRAHFAPIAEPTHVVMPVDRETGRPRGFAFVEFADRAVAEDVIKKFDAQPFQGRSLAVSEARAREDRPPGGPRPGGFSGPRPGGSFGGPRPGGSGGG